MAVRRSGINEGLGSISDTASASRDDENGLPQSGIVCSGYLPNYEFVIVENLKVPDLING